MSYASWKSAGELPDREYPEPRREPLPGERWQRKGTRTIVKVMYCVGRGPFGSPRQVVWESKNGQGRDSMESFLDRFEMVA